MTTIIFGTPVYNWIAICLDAVVAAALLCFMLEPRFRRVIVYPAWVLYNMLTLILGELLILPLLNDGAPGWIMVLQVIGCTVLDILVICVLFKGRLMKKILVRICYMIGYLLIYNSLRLLIGAVSSLSPGLLSAVTADMLLYALNSFFSALAVLIAIGLMRKKKPRTGELDRAKYGFFLIAQYAAVMVSTLFVYADLGTAGTLFFVLLIISIFIIADLFLFRAMRENIRAVRLAGENDMFRELAPIQQAYFESLLEQQRQASRLRHDYRNHVETVHFLIANGKSAEADEYLSQLSGELLGTTAKVYCENVMLDALFNNKQAAAKDMGIALNISVTLPEAVRLPELDMSTVFANLIDNAMNACRDIPGAAVNVRGSSRSGYYIIDIDNPVTQDVCFKGGLPASREKSRPGHGFGTDIVRLTIKSQGEKRRK